MRLSLVTIATAIAATVTLAAPVKNYKHTDSHAINVLNFALTLEHLESAFYKWGLDKFDDIAFKDAGYDHYRDLFVQIKDHESTHVDTLTGAIKHLHGYPVSPCKYKFPLDDVHSFITVARALETTGVSAYLGAASDISGKLLTAGATILSVKARQSALLNELKGLDGAPYAFDVPLNAREIFTLASNFIESCPYDLGIHPFTQLHAVLPKYSGEKVETSFYGENEIKKQTWCQFLYNNKVTVSVREKCTLPPGATGYVYVVITDSSAPISLDDDSSILAGPALLFNGDHY